MCADKMLTECCRYCVRPNSGRIESGKDVEVQVLLQAMKEDPPLDARCRDKFLVQSVAINSASDTGNVTQIWSSIEQTAKSSIKEQKIRVIFLPAEGSGAATTNGTIPEEEPPSYSSPSPMAVTPQKAVAPAPAPVAAPALAEREVKSDPTETKPSSGTSFDYSSNFAGGATNVASTRGVADVASPVAVATPQDGELKRQLEEAKATITRLQNEAAEGLRQRKTVDTTPVEKTINQVSQSLGQAENPAGVAVSIVAALCLLSFLIGYLFF